MDGTNLYQDPRIDCTPHEVRIRGYYFPWGTKRIPYTAIRGVERFELSALRGRWRIWGTGDFHHWANFDPGRPGKAVGLYLDLGRSVVPFLTPDDPDAAEAVIRARAHLGPS
jgi:hypothetical protein